MTGARGILAGKAFVEFNADKSPFIKAVRSMGKELQTFGTNAVKIGASVTAAMSTIAAAGTAITAAFAGRGAAIEELSRQTGIAASTLQELGFAATQSGTNLDTVTGGISELQSKLLQVSEGSTDAAKGLNHLGISADQLQQLKPDQQLGLIADRLLSISDVGERAAVATEIFGDAGRQMLPMLSKGSAGLKAYAAEANKLGGVMSGKDLAAAAGLSQAFNKLTTAATGVLNVVGAALAPVMTDIANLVTTAAVQFGQFLDTNRELIATVAKVVVGIGAAGVVVAAVGGSLAGVGTAAGIAAAAVSTIGGALAAILSPMGLVAVAVGGIATAFVTMTDTGRQMVTSLSSIMNDLLKRFRDVWGGISDAMSAGDLALAGRIAFQALNIEWMKATKSIREVWQTATGWIYDTWDTATVKIASLVNDFTAGVQSVWINTVDIIADAWDGAFLTMAQVASGMISGVTSQLSKLAGVLAEVTGIDIRQAMSDIGKAGQDYADRIAAASANSINTRGQARNERLAKLEADRKAAEELLYQDLQERILRRQLANEGKNDKAAKDLRDAMTDYAKALKEAADKKQGVADAVNPAVPLASPGTGSGTTPEIDAVRAALAQQQEIRKLTTDIMGRASTASSGTFSAAAAGRLTSTGDPNTSILRDIKRGILQLVDKKATLT